MSTTTAPTPRTPRRGLRVTLAERRERRRDRRRLERDLASFGTPAELQELETLLARATPEQAAEVERALVRTAGRRRAPHQLFDH